LGLRPYYTLKFQILADRAVFTIEIFCVTLSHLHAFNAHGMSFDQEGKFFFAEAGNDRSRKFHPSPGANPALLVSEPVYAAWK
jgi:hypothetical protein